MNPRRVAVLGAASLVGRSLLPQLQAAGWDVIALSRSPREFRERGIRWRQIVAKDGACLSNGCEFSEPVPFWICVAPIWVLPDYFQLLVAHGAKRVVALSSTSRFTKQQSTAVTEREVARRLASAEMALQEWSALHQVTWCILRPTLIYGRGEDRNVAEIARFIRRFGFFPRVGAASGLRQPIHADQVAQVCVAALDAPVSGGRAVTISGGETLSYREMVARVFAALERPVRMPWVPVWLVRAGVRSLRWLPRYRYLTLAMAERMNQDLVFSHQDAVESLAYQPRGFRLRPEDVSSPEPSPPELSPPKPLPPKHPPSKPSPPKP